MLKAGEILQESLSPFLDYFLNREKLSDAAIFSLSDSERRDLFSVNDKEPDKDFRFRDHAVWGHFQISNSEAHARHFVIRHDFHFTHRIDLYSQNETGAWQQQTAGFYISENSVNLPGLPYFNIVVPPGVQDIFIKLSGESRLKFWFTIFDTDSFYQTRQWDTHIYGLIMGGSILLLVLSLLQLINFKSKEHLLLASLIAAEVIAGYWVQKTPQAALFTELSAKTNTFYFSLIVAIFNIIFVQFFLSYSEVSKLSRWYTLASVYCILPLIGLPLSFINQQFYVMPFTLLFLFFWMPVVSWLCIVKRKEIDKTGIYQAGFFLFMASVVLWIFQIMNILPDKEVIRWSPHVGLVAMICVHFYGLANKFRLKQKETETEILHLNNSLQEQIRKVKENQKLRNQFFNNVSHELRTPLNGIIGFTSLFLKGRYGQLTPVAATQMKKINELSQTMKELVTSLLDLAKSRSGLLKPENSEFSLQDLVKEANLLAESLVSTYQKVMYKTESRFHIVPLGRWEGDRKKIILILRNLISNAFKFSDPDRINNVRICIECSCPTTLSILVSDTGTGIKEEDKKKIFDEFHQADGSTSRHYEGTGLGLALVKNMTSMMGGRIRVESEFQKGSSFRVDLPRASGDESREAATMSLPERKRTYPQPQPLENATTPTMPEKQQTDTPDLVKPSLIAAKPGYKFRVLVVDDNPVNLEVVKETLELHSIIETECVDGGQQAIETLKKEQFDLVLLDLMMPGVSGNDVISFVRSENMHLQMPVIILTAKISRADRLSCLNMGADDFITKPFVPEELTLRVHNTLNRLHSYKLLAQQEEILEHDRLNVMRQMANGLAHEINNPLAIISSGLLQLKRIVAKSSSLDQLALTRIDKIDTAARRIATIIRDLNNFTEIKGQDLPESCSLRVLLKQGIARIRKKLSQDKITLHIQEIPEINVYCRFISICQAVNAVLQNAAEACAGAEPDSRWIKILCSENPTATEISIVNGGETITPAVRNHIFEPFFTTKEIGHGKGLGLSSARGILNADGGSLRVGEYKGHTCFVISLPRPEQSDQENHDPGQLKISS